MQVARHWRNKKLRYRLILGEKKSGRKHLILPQTELAKTVPKGQEKVEVA